MLINFHLLIAIAALISGTIAFILFKLTSKNRKYTRGGFIAFFAVLFIFTGIMMMNARAYIVKSKTDVTRYAVYGTPEYKMTNGNIIKLEIKMQKCMIINDGEEDIGVQQVVYGYSGKKRPRITLVKPFEAGIINAMSIDHAFDDRPPSSAKTTGTGTVVKLWLRTKNDYEEDYGKIFTKAQIDSLRQMLKKKED